MSTETCEQRLPRHLESRLSDLRAYYSPEPEMVELVDDGTLDTVLMVGDEEFRFSDASAYRVPDIRDTHIHTWFERDRQHVELRDHTDQTTICEWWDDDVTCAIDDGFLDPRDYHQSAYDYAAEHDLLPPAPLDLESLLADEWDSMADTLRDRFYEYGLSFEYQPPTDERPESYFRYLLSFGGPQEEFRFYVNPDYSVHRIEFAFLDWFDGATQTLSGDDYDLMAQIFEDFRDCGSCEAAYNAA